jgi:hypothetical protein
LYGEEEVEASAEVYDPATNMWTPAAPMHVGRSGHTATRLGDGRVLVAGGGDPDDLVKAEMYTPASSQ